MKDTTKSFVAGVIVAWLLLSLAAVLLSCAPAGPSAPQPRRYPEEIVATTGFCQDANEGFTCPWAQDFQRYDPTAVAVVLYWAYSVDGDVCYISPQQWTLPGRGSRLACAWHRPRR